MSRNFVLSKKATHSHNPIASLSQSVITHCHQKNPLRVRTKPHIRLCKAWSSQRFKSLPSILCKIVVCTAGYLMKAGHLIQNIVSTGDLNRGRRACPACFLCYFLHAAKSNIPFPFRELSDKQKVCPCRGSTLRVLFYRLRRICLLLPQQACRFAAFHGASGCRALPAHAKCVRMCHASREYAACFASILRRKSRLTMPPKAAKSPEERNSSGQ